MAHRSPSPSVASARGRLAALSRTRADNDPALLAARQDLSAARIEDYIARVVHTAPPLSPAQKSRLAALLGAA